MPACQGSEKVFRYRTTDRPTDSSRPDHPTTSSPSQPNPLTNHDHAIKGCGKKREEDAAKHQVGKARRKTFSCQCANQAGATSPEYPFRSAHISPRSCRRLSLSLFRRVYPLSRMLLLLLLCVACPRPLLLRTTHFSQPPQAKNQSRDPSQVSGSASFS